MKLLEGIRVLDISTVIAAPFAAGLMADFGAEVIKVEMPDGGDPFRRLGPYHEGQAMRFACMGRNKKSITLDLRTEKGKEIFLQEGTSFTRFLQHLNDSLQLNLKITELEDVTFEDILLKIENGEMKRWVANAWGWGPISRRNHPG